MKLLNLGCGGTFHKDWINMDFVSNSNSVISCNLLKGIPLGDTEIDVVYHSHVLEHFNQDDGVKFLNECYRVMKSRAIIRIAVPDLEGIVRSYLKNLELAVAGDDQAKNNYNWIILELFDQMVRNQSGGKMKAYLESPVIDNENFVYKRIGVEGRNIRECFLENQLHRKDKLNHKSSKPFLLRKFFKKMFRTLRGSQRNLKLSAFDQQALKIGKFRLGGEIHQWMYDRYSLEELLLSVGFTEVRVCNALESQIENWDDYQLDVVKGEVRKPDSLFIEALKP